MEPTFGIEEEFVLLDPHTLTAVDRAPEAIAALSGARGAVGKEFFPSQIEFASPVFASATEALDAVWGFRRSLAAWAGAEGLVAAGTGTPFRTVPRPEVSADIRYAHIAADIAGVTPDHQINGLHVHVGIPDAESGVRASNTLRVWLPTLLALSSNSPYWHGEDTGFESWRAIHSRRWTTYGAPPFFRDAAEHEAARRALRGIGATSDPGTINWNVRLSARYPTVEVRVFDAQLDPRSSVALAAITRALVASADLPTAPETRHRLSAAMDLTDAALWHAARFGVSATLVHPFSGRVVPAREVVRALDERIRPHLADRAEGELVDEFVRRTIRDGPGATRQRRAGTAGLGRLAMLYRQELAGAGSSTGLSA
ncbi:YbdK family carboxylate-amine ligase [Microbacterium sp. HD4P20]|uniref:carboxylate-amine ligase n=1 Tax=Microbacterium sp. HD4P20 TaxID=2864874 RepID=UPI001C644009|nr:YbdK family carboxylate-amine ligase [Microbacterium sp. HD4P20]MCP2637917.1 YbdK family carboxylate-amine ligase [Microbacterium sp. HD4P20]